MRRVTTVASLSIALLALCALFGCGSSSSANKVDIEKVVEAMRSGSVLTRNQATCVADAAVPKVTSKGLKELEKKTGDLTTLSSADQKVVFDSFTGCLTVAQLSPTIAKAFDASKAEDKCYSDVLTSKYKTSGEVMQALTTHSKAFVAAVTGCVSPDSLRQALVSAMTSSNEFTKAQAGCVVDKLFANTSQSDLSDLESGKASDALRSKLTSYATDCAGAK